MRPRGPHRACVHVSCVCVFLLFPALSAEKLDKTSLPCQVLHGNNQKWMVSPVWRRKCCLRSLECGRALNNYRNKSLALDPTPGVHSWRGGQRWFQHLCWPGWSQGEHRYSILRLLLCPALHAPGVTKGAVGGSHGVMFGL